MADTRIRLFREGDWDEVVALEERAYATSGLSEGREALRSRHRASPSTCFVLEHAGGFGGYLLALPYPLFRCPDLSLAEEDAAQERNGGSNLHTHDLAIAERAARYRTLSLVAVRGSETLWSRLGYRARPEIGLPASYGAEAVYMAKPLELAATDPAPTSRPRAEAG